MAGPTGNSADEAGPVGASLTAGGETGSNNNGAGNTEASLTNNRDNGSNSNGAGHAGAAVAGPARIGDNGSGASGLGAGCTDREDGANEARNENWHESMTATGDDDFYNGGGPDGDNF